MAPTRMKENCKDKALRKQSITGSQKSWLTMQMVPSLMLSCIQAVTLILDSTKTRKQQQQQQKRGNMPRLSFIHAMYEMDEFRLFFSNGTLVIPQSH